MTRFKISPLPASLANEIRTKRIDRQGHQLVATPAGQGTGPCRVCLKKFVPTDMRILFSYSPNESDHPYNEIGPVYIHEDECAAYDELDRFPSEVKNDRVNFPLTLRCYDKERRMIHAELVGERDVEELIEKLFADRDIEFIHARNAAYGCFITRIERA